MRISRPILFGAGVLCVVFVLAAIALNMRGDGDMGCVSRNEEYVLSGSSLSGIYEDGDRIEVLFGYYDCNDVRRDDVVAYAHSSGDEPLIKIIKAVPGDTFRMVQDEYRWRILVNGEQLMAVGGEPYTITAARYPRLHLYEEDYGQGLPPDTYMLLGTDPYDSFDSRAFGLVHRSDILGKVKIPGR